MTSQTSHRGVHAATSPIEPSGSQSNSTGRIRKSSMPRVLTPALTALAIAGLSAVPAAAAGTLPATGAAGPVPAADCPKPFPEVLPLPNGFSPESIAIHKGVAYTGSVADGSIQRIDLRTGAVRQFAPSPGAHRIAMGMEVDRFGRLWVAGSGSAFGGNAEAGFRVYDAKSGALLADVSVPGTFLNDVTVARDAVWFTDSLNPNLIRVPIAADGKIGSPEKVALGGDWVQNNFTFNANGIVPTPDDRHLIVIQTRTPERVPALYLVPTRTAGEADARRIALRGTLAGGDGLALVGRTLYVANANGVDKVRLSRSLTAGEVLGTTNPPGVAWPSAGKAFGGRLYVVDANFGENFSNIGNPAAEFKVVGIPLP
ncbi:hypothetical protein AB0K68_24745 [Streptomyces sp. NPDC050698]